MEIWKDIEGYPDYEVSNLGRVMSYKGRVPRIMKGQSSNSGYQRLLLNRGRKPYIRKHHSIHRLVAFAFIPNPKNKPEVNHKNGVKTDNKVENLEWCTSSENRHHADRTGLSFIKLTFQEVKEIRASKIPNRVLAKKYKVSPRCVSGIRNGKRRIHS